MVAPVIPGLNDHEIPTILTAAAEAIGDWLRSGARDPESLEAVASRVNAIFEACSFQDITSQRIRRAIEHLQQVETMLSDLAPSVETAQQAPGSNDPDLEQEAVDAMFR